jgi:AmpD protein
MSRSAASHAVVVDLPTGLLRGVRQVLSPHFDARPDGMRPELIVVHGISLPPDEFGGGWVERFFCGNLPPAAHPYFSSIAGVRVSAHALIARDGAITQFVPFHGRAWHAGASRYEGRERCNDFSIGIELEGADTTPYTDAQYVSLVSVVRSLCAAYPGLAPARLVGHSDIAPGRKSDPGPAFDWTRLRAAVESQTGDKT